eukprot:scaffold284270_cov39-Tisochrysis_lutea.AAC.2
MRERLRGPGHMRRRRYAMTRGHVGWSCATPRRLKKEGLTERLAAMVQGAACSPRPRGGGSPAAGAGGTSSRGGGGGALAALLGAAAGCVGRRRTPSSYQLRSGFLTGLRGGGGLSRVPESYHDLTAGG